MKTRATATILSTLITASLLGLTTNPATIQATSNSYQTIQEAINNAEPGDTILVAAGTYKENVVINQTITLMGSGQDSTFIEAKDEWKAVIEIKTNNANLSGFTIKNGTVGVSLSGYNASTISNNTIISNSDKGIHLRLSHNNLIANNTISSNEFEGIFLQNSTNNSIRNNVVTRNAHAGIDLLYSRNNTISNNTVSLHENVQLHNQGIWMESSDNNTIDSNIISNNAYGIDIYISNNNTITGNTVSGSHYGISLERSKNQTVHHNNLFYNKHQVDSYLSSNTWDNGTEGNYWSDYNGKDADGNGIGDTPYVILGDNPDRYPLMEPWKPFKDSTPPSTSDDYDGLWHNADFAINLTAVDDISGVRAIYYRINDATTFSNVSANGQPLINIERANNTLEYWSMDGVGNKEEPHHNLVDIKLDKTVPSGSITINNDDSNTTSPSVTLNLFANDTLSGVSQMQFSNDGLTWDSWETYTTTKTWNLTSDDGLKTVYVQYMDNAGLVSQAFSDTIILDTTAPTVWILSPTEGSEIKSSNVIIQWNGTDAGSGINHYELTLDASSPINVGIEQTHTLAGLSDGSHTVVVKAYDNIGRASEASVNFIVNTSPLGGAGYLEEATLIAIVAVAIGIIAYILTMRKKRRLQREPNLSAKT